MASAWRLFIAHPVPGTVRDELQAQLEPYRRRYPHVRWTRPATWHLTLLFLGSVDPSREPELRLLVDAVAERVGPYHVVADEGDGRVHRGEGVAWLRLGEGARQLVEAATLTAGGCPPDVTGGRPPKRTPSAHLTVARRADRTVIDALRGQAHGPLGVGWTVEHIDLVRSHLGPGGSRYETLHRAAL